ncbi:hypothetical protein BT96DRAFT_294513 [Gymnopus androsaceus JB14]|uniref:Uncharacterized protein n=1 Tax=Gymnopus androsaceus JB14 TaxID=1447944 RepID=A0A6A4I7P2_9AGAR|nr:hypothetical protein BT96DRAFT_294513 [Gymnopus androsaceus JB14]
MNALRYRGYFSPSLGFKFKRSYKVGKLQPTVFTDGCCRYHPSVKRFNLYLLVHPYGHQQERTSLALAIHFQVRAFLVFSLFRSVVAFSVEVVATASQLMMLLSLHKE